MSVDLSVSNTTKPEAGLDGGLANTDDARVITRVTAAALDFGVACKRTSTGVTVIADSADVVEGITVRDSARKTASGSLTYAIGDAVAICREGAIFATPYEDVTKDAAVYFREADGRLGDSTTSGSTGPVPGAYWDEAGTSAAPARIRMNMTN